MLNKVGQARIAANRLLFAAKSMQPNRYDPRLRRRKMRLLHEFFTFKMSTKKWSFMQALKTSALKASFQLPLLRACSKGKHLALFLIPGLKPSLQ